MKTALCITVVIIGWLIVSEMDYRDQVSIAAERQCLAQKVGERAISERRKDGSVSCTRHENIGAGMAPRFVSADVWAK